MFCEQTQKVSALIDGELTTLEARVLEQHLAGCEECREARAEFLNLRSQIAELDPVANPLAASGKLSEILQGRNVRAAASSTSPQVFQPFVFRPAFAAIIVIFVAAIVAFLVYQSQSQKLISKKVEDQAGPPKSVATPEGRPAPSPGPTTKAESNKEDHEKAKVNKPVKQKKRSPQRGPGILAPDRDLVSPWSNQAIAQLNDSERLESVDLVAIRTAEAQSLTVRHLGHAELLLRSFRNLRASRPGRWPTVAYERTRAEKLVYQNILLRREAEVTGDVQVATLLENLEPILLDIANLPEDPREADVQIIKKRLQRKNLVALLQVHSTSLARANE